MSFLRRKYRGKVLVDLLFANGKKANRCFVADFDGQKFDPDHFDSAMHRYESLSPMSAEVLKGHYSEVDPSLLTPAMKFALRNYIPF